MENSEIKIFYKNGRCSKQLGHKSSCNKKRSVNPFWTSSPVLTKEILKAYVKILENDKILLLELTNEAKITLDAKLLHRIC